MRNKLVPVVCQLGTVKAGAKVTITVRARATKQSPRYKNTSSRLGTATYDPTLTNNVAHATVAVVAPPPPVGLG